MSTVLGSRITDILNKLISTLGNQAYIYTAQILLTINIPANAPANQPIPVSMSVTLGQTTISNQTSIVVPATQVWILVDVYTTTSPTIDGTIQIYKNGVKLLETTPNLSALLVTNPARLLLPIPAKFAPQEVLNINFVPASASGTTPVTQYAYALVIIVDFTYSQLPPATLAGLAQRV